jgi:hypothetical protein
MTAATESRIDVNAIAARVLDRQRVNRFLQQHGPVLITRR